MTCAENSLEVGTMNNIYIGSFKDILKGYYTKQKKLNEEIERNKQRFAPEYADKYNAEVKAKQAQAYNDARQSITDVFEQVRGFLANASFLNVESLTADRLIFADNSGFDLTPEDVRGYVERYQGNYTMLRLIRDWITKHKKPEDGQLFGKYHDIKIVLPADQLQVYKQFADSALRICDRIFTNGNVMSDPLEIECFADPRMAGTLLGAIGSGMELSDYKNHRVPESVKHSFDGVTLATHVDNGNVFVQ